LLDGKPSALLLTRIFIHIKYILKTNATNMAPSITETITSTTDQIQEKLAAITTKDGAAQNGVKHETSALAVQEPEVKEAEVKKTPKVEAQHKEPLKLSGVLDAFEYFDVTPTIGREFSGVNLKKWLRAPNSDDLIRDLAITSMHSFSDTLLA
jgi:hypothetical protein